MHKLSPTAAGKAAHLSLRLPSHLLELVNVELARLRRLAPMLRATPSDALRSLLEGVLAQRAAASSTVSTMPTPATVLHTAANGASVATRVGNDNGGAALPRPRRGGAATPTELEALAARLDAANAAGHSDGALALGAGLDRTVLKAWRGGRRTGIRGATIAAVGAHLAALGF